MQQVIFKKPYVLKDGVIEFFNGEICDVIKISEDGYIIRTHTGERVLLDKKTIDDNCVLVRAISDPTFEFETQEWSINSTTNVVARLIKEMKSESAIREVLEAYKKLEY